MELDYEKKSELKKEMKKLRIQVQEMLKILEMEKGWRGWRRGWYRKMNRFRSWPQIKKNKVKILWMLVKRKEEKNWKQTEKKK